MPTYAYKCRDCGRTLEVQQAFTDASLTECPHCGGALRKQYGTVGVTFNGSGFYRTDSRAKPEGADGGTRSSDSGDSSGGTKGGEKSDGGSSSGGGASSGAASSGADAKPAAAPAKPVASTPAS